MANHKLRAALIGACVSIPAGIWCLSTLAHAAEDSKDEAGGKSEVSALVTTAALQRGPINTLVSGYGTVVAMPGKARNLTFPQAGLVSEVRVSIGERVKRGATLLALATDPAGRLAYEQAQTGVDFTRSELERTRQLRSQHLATDSQLAAAEKGLHDAEATLAAQRQLGTSTPASELKAPFDGVVLDIPVALGDRTAAGAVLARMVPADAVQVLVGLAPGDARRVRAGMKARLKSISGGDAQAEARVTQVQAMLNPQSHLIDVTVQPLPSTADTSLFPAEAAQASIVLATTTALLAPRAAVLRDDGGAYLFEVVDGHAERVNVSTGAEDGQMVAVEAALDAGQKIVVLGAYELEDGMAVHEAEPAGKDGAQETGSPPAKGGADAAEGDKAGAKP